MKSNDEYYFGTPLDVPGEPLKNSSPPRPVKKRRRFPVKKIFILTAFLIGLAAVAFGAWKFFGQKDPGVPAAQGARPAPESTPPESQANQVSEDTPAVKDTKTFKTDHPRVSFDYPSGWTVTEKDGGVRVESSTFKYATTEAGQVEGNFRVYIRQQARGSDSKYIGRGVAIQASEKLTYSQPVVGQLPETNLIRFGSDASDHFAYFFVAGNYSLQKNDTLGPDYGKEPETYIITGGYSSGDLADDMATHKVSLDSYAGTNAFKQALDIIKSLKLL